MGGVDDLFAIRFLAFTVFRAFPPPSIQIHNIQSIQSMRGVDDLFALMKGVNAGSDEG